MAVHACDTDLIESHRARLGKLDCGKGCIRFRKTEDLPLDVVEAILRDLVKRRRS